MTAQQLKNSILQMAVQGKLVPQDPNDEPASVLLERIRAEKEQLIKEGKIKKEKNPSVIFRGADNLPYEKVGKNEPVCIADEVPFDIPESWEWVTLKQIAVTALGKTLDKSKNIGEYRPYLCSINVYWTGLLCPQYLKHFMESPLYWQQLKTGTTATAQPNCNGQTLSNMLLPLPPAKEQYRIVEKINRAFVKVK